MIIEPIRDDLQEYLEKYNLVAKWDKQKEFFIFDMKHPSLNTEY